jgi:hypothetical protein
MSIQEKRKRIFFQKLNTSHWKKRSSVILSCWNLKAENLSLEPTQTH